MKFFVILAIISSFFLFGCILRPIIKVDAPNCYCPPEDIIASVENNVVNVLTYDSAGRFFGQGTGFIVRKDGLIATAGHMANADVATIFVKFREKNMAIVKEAEVFAKSPDRDIVLLKVPYNFKTQMQMDKREVKNDEPMFALGYPLPSMKNLLSNDPPKIIRGRFLMYYDMKVELFPVQRVMLIDMNGAFGNSGSPILDRNGKVVGIYIAVKPKLPGTFAMATETKHIIELLL